MGKKKENIEKNEPVEVLTEVSEKDSLNGEAQSISENKKEKEKTPKTKKTPKKKKASVRDLIDGSILTRDYVVEQLPFLFFLTILAMIYIGNKYNSEKMSRETELIQKELKELRCEKLSVQSELMSICKQSEVAKLIEEKGLDLFQLIDPPKKIIIGEKNNPGAVNNNTVKNSK
ncbi:MAG: hypothetical protein HY958_06505 [Bacteroidia bacterium]|nr:hypothetical protein [Bacteroidia bacterium]